MASNNKNEEVEEVTKNTDDLSIDSYIKHPLQNTWTLWYYEHDRIKNWEENQKKIISFDTAEDFWSLFTHIKLASDLRQGCDYSLFKKDIRPMWEDDANKRGGRWLISLDKKQRTNDLDNYWREVLLCLIGEAFDEHSDEVCGAVVNIRGKGDKIGVWTADCSKGNSVIEIGKKIKERLKMDRNTTLVYQAHNDLKVKTGSITKNIYTV
uniref:eIF-4F 25 kDa subunit n=1 Tax=Euborellia annulipes TaxID=146833 RepID=A0A8S4C3E4_9NEOP|nr:Eukaryotic translation initiation factor 4E1 [Euborellia annulipes]CAG6407544.1 Eukaryotic translation initiation factor 4E 1 [Euborellia annulipes]